MSHKRRQKHGSRPKLHSTIKRMHAQRKKQRKNKSKLYPDDIILQANLTDGFGVE